MQPGEALILQPLQEKPAGLNAWLYAEPAGNPIEIKGNGPCISLRAGPNYPPTKR